MTKGKLFVVSGPSGAGKGTICKEVLDEERNIKLSVSMTTRKPREGEIDKVHYHFVDRSDFEALIEEEGFMEYANVYGNFYGTPRKQVLEWLEQGIDVILEIDVQGALQIKKTYPEGVFIFILPPSIEELKKRIKGRGSETEETMAKRLGAALKEISCIDQYDYRVINEELQTAIDRVRSIIKAEQCKLNDEEVENIVENYKEEL
ncbi:MAG: guanylate kinase [Bacillota bacterium]|nr:guanylate kinase [Bacillota bacterium]